MSRSSPVRSLRSLLAPFAPLARFLALTLLLAVPRGPALLQAQSDGPLCIDCVPDYAVQVTPDGGTEPGRAAFTPGYQTTFTVKNAGSLEDTYDLTCTAPNGGSCSVNPAQVSLGSQSQTTATVTYSTGAAGVWAVALQAESPESDVTDGGSRNVTVTGEGFPVLATTPQNTTYRNTGLCLAACFDGLYQHATPAWFSFGQARGVSLIYNGGTHKPMPAVYVDASLNPQSSTPTAWSIKVGRYVGGNLTWLTLQNGSTVAYFSPAATTPTRLGAVFDALANGLGTGRHAVTVSVTAHYPSQNLESVVATYALVNDQSASVYGQGVSLGQTQRLKELGSPGDDVLILEPDGSIAFYDYSAGYAKPLGGPESRLVYNGGNPASSRYTRTWLDSSYVQFNNKGFMTRASDRFGNATTYAYYAAPYDTLLAAITGPTGKMDSLCYTATGCGAANARLHHVNSLTGAARRTVSYTYDGSSRLIRALDPDGYSDSLAYGANGVLAGIYDRARQRTDLLYNGALRLDSVQAPSITLFDGSAGRPTTRFRSLEQTVWQPATAGTSIGSPKTGVRGDSSLKVLVVGPVFDTTKFTVNSFGSPTKITDPFRFTTLITRDGHSRPTRIDEPNGHYVTFTYNAYDQLTGTTDGPSGRTIAYHYRNTGTTDLSYVDGDVVRQDFTYHDGSQGPVGALLKVYIGNTSNWPTIGNSARLVSHHRPDNLGRDTAVLDSLGHGTHVTYESTWGQVWKVKDQTGVEVRFTYDVMGRRDTTVTPLMGKSWVTYGTMNQALTQGQPGYRTSNGYDPATLALIRVQTPRVDTSATATVYGPPVVFKYGYNALGQLIRRHDTADTAKVDNFKYDIGGRLRVFVPRDSTDSLVMTYDKTGALLSRVGRGVADYFRYDTVAGRWAVDSNAVAVNTDSLDWRGRPVLWRQVVNGRTYTGQYTYDAYDRVTRRTLTPSNVPAEFSDVKFVYALGVGIRDSLCVFSVPRCVTFKRKGDFVADTLVYNRGQGNAWKLYQSLDGNHRITAQNYAQGSGLGGFDQTIIYDSLGRVRNRTSPLSGYTRRVFAYDSLGRLVNACDSTGSVCQNTVNQGTSGNAWAWDSAGNRDQVGLTEDYGAGNRLLAAGTTTFYHDLVARVTCRIIGTCPSGTGTGYKYQWDALGRLRSIRNGSTNALIDSLSYDARGRRVRKQTAADTTYFVYEGSQIIFDMNATDSVRREYAWYPGGVDRLLAMRTPSDTLAALLDPITGTVRGLARFRNGARVKEYNEAPWGDAVADTGLVVRYRFAGREWDQESGLYYMRARYYDPQLGRWVSEDPIGLGGGGNLFGYAGGDPVNGRDPSGLDYRWTSEGYCQEMANVTWHTVDSAIVGYTVNYTWNDCIPSGDLMGTGGDPTNANKGEQRPGATKRVEPGRNGRSMSECVSSNLSLGTAAAGSVISGLLGASVARQNFAREQQAIQNSLATANRVFNGIRAELQAGNAFNLTSRAWSMWNQAVASAEGAGATAAFGPAVATAVGGFLGGYFVGTAAACLVDPAFGL